MVVKNEIYYGADDEERRNRCLTCEKPRCNNCLAKEPNPKGRRKKRSWKEVKYASGDKTKR